MKRKDRDDLSRSSDLRELRFRLGIKNPSPDGDFAKRAVEFAERAKAVFQKSKRRSIAGRVKRGMQHRWTAEEDEKLNNLRASGLGWVLIAKHLHRTPKAVKNRFSRLQAKLGEDVELY